MSVVTPEHLRLLRLLLADPKVHQLPRKLQDKLWVDVVRKAGLLPLDLDRAVEAFQAEQAGAGAAAKTAWTVDAVPGGELLQVTVRQGPRALTHTVVADAALRLVLEAHAAGATSAAGWMRRVQALAQEIAARRFPPG